MTPPEPWPDILAAYADGELTPAARAAVERWLAAHPADRELLRTQQAMGPANWRLWRDADPPQPAPAQWAAVRRAIGGGLTPEPAAGRWGGWRGWAAAAAVLVAAAAGLVFAFGPRLNPPAQEVARPGAGQQNPDVAVRPAPMPRERTQPGRVPPDSSDLPDGPFVLAGDGDVQVAGVEPHPAWPGGEPRMTTAPGDNPMIFAAGLR